MRAPIAGLAASLLAATEAAGRRLAARRRARPSSRSASRYSTGARTLVAAMQDIRSYSSIYVEHGLTERLTSASTPARAAARTSALGAALVFARLPVWSPGEHQLAADLGLGLLEDDVDGPADARPPRPRLGPRLREPLGRRLARDGGVARVRASRAATVAVKADFTAGLKPNDRWMLILQLQTGVYPDAGAARAPGAVGGPPARRRAATCSSAASRRSPATTPAARTLALWLTF